MAHALHACGPKQGKPFVSVDCAGLGDHELALRLFDNKGDGQDGEPVFSQSRGGTLCLENVDALPMRHRSSFSLP